MSPADAPRLQVAPEPAADPVIQLPLRNFCRMANLLVTAMHRSDVDGPEVELGAAMIGEVLSIEADVVLDVVRAHPVEGLAEQLLHSAS